MKIETTQFKQSLFVYLLLGFTLFFSSCGDDDTPSNTDQPFITAPTEVIVKAGESVALNFTVIVPGIIAEIKAEASAGDVSVQNAEALIGQTNGNVVVNYTPASNISGGQTVTLEIVDQQDQSNSQSATVEVFAPVTYGMALVSGSGGVQTTFLQGMLNLDLTTVNNSNSTELAQFAAIYSDGNALFTAGFGAPATMGKYTFNSTGNPVLDQQIVVPGSNSFSAVEIIDPTIGYATVGGGLSRAIQFDPTEMRITGEIDLSSAGDGLFYSDLIVRDNFLFVALNDFGDSAAVRVAVINRTSNTLEKVISDSRTATLFGTLTTSIMVTDANGDIYVQGSGLFSEKPAGILRIKAGETEFDTEYFFDLGAATGNTCFGLYHFGDGLTFTTVSEDDNNFFGFDGANPVFRYQKINLSNTTDLGDLDATLPNTFAASRTMFMQQLSANEILFPIAGTDEDALYIYDITTGNVSKKITSESGYVTGLVKINQ